MLTPIEFEARNDPVSTVHLGMVDGLRATILAYGGLTQVVLLAVVQLGSRRRRAGARSQG